MTSEAIKLQLVREIINLQEKDLTALRDFLNQLVSYDPVNGHRSGNGSDDIGLTSGPASASIEDNPMLEFIGLASYDPPVKSIDEELYGDDPL